MEEARFGLHAETRKVWITKGVRPSIRRKTRYEWDYLYGALDVVEGRAEFLHLPTVNLECPALFLERLHASDPQAQHVVIADQAGFHLRQGDSRLPELVHILPLPPLQSGAQSLRTTLGCDPGLRGLCQRAFQIHQENASGIASGSSPLLGGLEAVLSLVGRPWLRDQANATAKI